MKYYIVAVSDEETFVEGQIAKKSRIIGEVNKRMDGLWQRVYSSDDVYDFRKNEKPKQNGGD